LERRLISRIYKELQKHQILNTKRISNQINKWTNELNKHASKEELKMARKYMKKCLTTLAIKEMQIKTSRFHLTRVRMSSIKKTNSNKFW
jgi:hypothetical protein